MLHQDGPEHRSQRTATARCFAPATVSRGCRGLMEGRADELVEGIGTDGGAELPAATLRCSVEVAAQAVGLTDSDVGGTTRRLEHSFAVPLDAARPGVLGRARAGQEWREPSPASTAR